MTPNLLDIFTNETDSENLTSSSYFDTGQFGDYVKSNKPSDISIFNNNSRSLLKNKSQYDIIFALLKQKYHFEFDIITFDETWLCNELEDLVTFENYNSVYKHKEPQKEGGGLAIYIRNHLEHVVRNDILIPENLKNIFDCLTIELLTSTKNIIVSLIYRSPSHDSVADVTNYLQEISKKFSDEGKHKSSILLKH